MLHPREVSGPALVIALFACLVALFLGVEFTHTRVFKRRVSRTHARKQWRVLLYVLVTSVGLSLAAVSYLAATASWRRRCWKQQGLPNTPEVVALDLTTGSVQRLEPLESTDAAP